MEAAGETNWGTLTLVARLEDPKPFFRNVYRAGELAQGLRTLAAFAEDQNSVPNTHTVWFTTACASSSRNLTPSSGLCGQLHSCVHT